jgi:Tol biopolymer transport system component
MQVYLQDFPGLERRIQVSDVPGSMPLWSPDGRRMYYVDREGGIHQVTLAAAGATLEVSEDKTLFSTRMSYQARTHQFGITPDEEHFLVLERIGDGSRPVELLRAVFHWRAPEE